MSERDVISVRAAEADKAAKQARIYEWEGGLILQLDRLATVNAKLMKQLARGRVSSEVAGAYMDLRNIANHIERLSKDIPE